MSPEARRDASTPGGSDEPGPGARPRASLSSPSGPTTRGGSGDRAARAISPAESNYLDILRSGAALAVALHHFARPELSGAAFSGFKFGHEAVVVFFVLSGYVISYVYQVKEASAGEFVARRAARLLSVLPAAILISVGCDLLVRNFGAEPAAFGSDLEIGEYLANSCLSMTFLNYSWGEKLFVGNNGVLWSVACEWWYYLGFAAIRFLRPVAAATAILLMFCIVGPPVAVLAPVWILGCAAFSVSRMSLRFKRPVPALVFALSAVLMVAFLTFDLGGSLHLKRFLGVSLRTSDGFITDFLLGCLVAANIASAAQLCRNEATRFTRLFGSFGWTKHSAGISYTLYCIHLPIFYALGSLISYDRQSLWQVVLIFILGLLMASTPGLVLEPLKKNLYALFKSWFPFDVRRGGAMGSGRG